MKNEKVENNVKSKKIINKAYSMLEKNQYNKIILFLNRHKGYFNNSKVQSLLADCYAGLKDYKKAIRRYEKAIKLNNYKPEIFLHLDYIGLAGCYNSMGDLKKTKEVLEKGLKVCKEKEFLSGVLKIINKQLKKEGKT